MLIPHDYAAPGGGLPKQLLSILYPFYDQLDLFPHTAGFVYGIAAYLIRFLIYPAEHLVLKEICHRHIQSAAYF